MSFHARVIALAAGLVLAASALTGCVGGQTFSDLEREPSADDALPAVNINANIDEASVRFVGEYEGTRLWLMESDQGMCLLQYPNSREWTSGCTESAGEFGSAGPGGTFVVIPDDGYPPKGAVKISENVYAKH
jgi:hypothetical protein